MTVFIVLAGVFALMFITILVWVIRVIKAVITTFKEGQNVKYMNFRKQNEFARHGQTVFSGNSITEQYPVEEWFGEYTAKTGQRVYNRGVGGEVSAGLLKQYPDVVLPLEPSTIVLLVGTNDLAMGVKETEIIKNISEVIRITKARLPDTKIILQAVYPVNPSKAVKEIRFLPGQKRTNGKIDSLNIALEALAKEWKIIWVDTTGKLRDRSGLLKSEYSPDGLHLNAEGYAVISAALSVVL
ncbi:MAG: GDSL-type esterase/lipase family protein [Treponema sp.]|jgi:lysophospholipase L1-like esterase|nr:GDSL-type esterase/lipase family protein [Treponema sp.]